jgi:hypothetical protein
VRRLRALQAAARFARRARAARERHSASRAVPRSARHLVSPAQHLASPVQRLAPDCSAVVRCASVPALLGRQQAASQPVAHPFAEAALAAVPLVRRQAPPAASALQVESRLPGAPVARDAVGLPLEAGRAGVVPPAERGAAVGVLRAEWVSVPELQPEAV